MLSKLQLKLKQIFALIYSKIQLNKAQIKTNQNSSNKEIELELEYNEFGYPQNLKKNQSNKVK